MEGETLYFTGVVNDGLEFNGDGQPSQIIATGSVAVAGAPGRDGTPGQKGDAGVGLPIGGTTGQTLSKLSDGDFAAVWVTLAKDDVGLGNVDNTSDVDKPVSTAQASSIATKEPIITAGTTSQYYRGDKTFQTLNKSAVGLSNVDNTSDASKPISTATQTALNAKVAKGELVVNVKDAPYNAVGDGVTNDTAAFAAASAAITAADGGTLFIPKGDYVVGSQVFAGTTGLGYAYQAADIIKISECTKGVTILSDGAKLQFAAGMKFGSFDPVTGSVYNPSSLPFYGADYQAHIGYAINLINNQSITIAGRLEIDGNDAAMVLGGQYGDTGRQLIAYGVRSVGHKSADISGVYTHHNCLDGLYIGQYAGYDATERRPVTIRNVISEYNCRQAFSLTGGNGFTVINCKFNYTGRSSFSSAPRAGVDIEAELGLVRNVTFENCEFKDNAGAGMVASAGNIADVTFHKCSFSGYNTDLLWPEMPRMAFEDCLIAGSIVNAYGDQSNPQDSCRFIRCEITDEVSKVGGTTTKRIVDTANHRGVVFEDTTFISSLGRYAYIINATLRKCNFIQKAGTESLLANNGITLYLTNSSVSDLTVIDAVANPPANGYAIDTGSTVFSGMNNLISSVGAVKWNNGTSGWTGYYGQTNSETRSGRSVAINRSLQTGASLGVNKLYFNATSPASGSYAIGDRIINQNPTSGANDAWACTVAGTMGTLNSGATTGSITIGTKILTVSTATGITVGTYLSVAGAITSSIVTGVTGTTVTLTDNATATVSGAAVSYVVPTFIVSSTDSVHIAGTEVITGAKTLSGAVTLGFGSLRSVGVTRTVNGTFTSSFPYRNLANATSGPFTLTLPSAASASGLTFYFKKIDSTANAVTISRAGSDTIEGNTTYALSSQYEYVELYSDGVSTWYSTTHSVDAVHITGAEVITGAKTFSGAFTYGFGSVRSVSVTRTTNGTFTSSFPYRNLANATSGPFTLTLPAAASASGLTFYFKKIDSTANAVTIARAGSDTIEGNTSYALTSQNDYIELYSDGVSTWYATARGKANTSTTGTATLVAGTVTVNTTAITASSIVMLTVQSLGTVSVPKAMAKGTVVAGTSFVINSADATDTSTVGWMIIN